MKKFFFHSISIFWFTIPKFFFSGKEKDFTINGTIKGLGNDSVIVYKNLMERIISQKS
ncbi:MAG: hypothetical protein IPL04_13695 [Chitinophagaceae bacterium]|nr:hypothetical protein [Chitinophagaceae bacterium]